MFSRAIRTSANQARAFSSTPSSVGNRVILWCNS